MLKEFCNNKYGRDLSACSNEEIYVALLEMTKELSKNRVSEEGKKKIYYISAEFLIGKLLSNNLINLGVFAEVKAELEAAGKSIYDIEEIEPEPSLGNGGLGRLAACFLDSMASIGINGDGIGLNYHFGLFKQVFENNFQKETKNPWIENTSWLTKTDKTYEVQFGGFSVKSVLYDIDVTGYENRTNKLHLFDIESIDESLVWGDDIHFDKTQIAKNLTLFLYPDDSTYEGKELRLKQQYFFSAAGVKAICKKHKETYGTLTNLRPNANPNSEYGKWIREEVRRCFEGYVRESDGEWVTGDMYFFLNYCPIQLTKKDPRNPNKTIRVVDFPKVWEGHYYVFHYLNEARNQGKHGADRGGFHLWHGLGLFAACVCDDPGEN